MCCVPKRYLQPWKAWLRCITWSTAWGAGRISKSRTWPPPASVRRPKVQGVQRIIYLGGLGDPAAKLSAHLRSRQETGNALREAGVPVTEFRAAVVIGSGSLSFELIRYLSERLPVMICPLWVYTRIQPIAIQNVLDYLVAALEQLESTGRIIEIGGEDVVTYGVLMETYATARGLKRYL